MEKNILTDILLDEAGIDRISEQLQEWVEKTEIERKNAIRLRIALEDLLQDLCIHYERKNTVSIEMDKKHRKTVISIRYPGTAYNPVQNAETEEWSQMILSQLGLAPVWHYRHGVNELTLSLAGNRISGELWLVIAFAAAVVLGFCRPLLPPVIVEILTTYFFSYLTKIFMNLLGTFAGILVFFSVISGICGIGSISDFSRMGKYLISRNVISSFIGAGFCAALMIPCFSFHYGQAGGAGELTSVIDMILAVIPSDPVTPFQTGNTLQIVFMALMIGSTTVLLGSRSATVREMFIQANMVVLRIVGAVCSFLPVYIFSSLTMMFWENGMGIFLSIWKPLVLCMVMTLLLLCISVVTVSIKKKVPLPALIRKVMPGYLIGLTTASSTAAFGTILDENENALGIDPQLSNFGTPLEMILSSSTMSTGYLAVLYFLIEYNGVEITPLWFISAWLLVTIISFALPPVSGGTLIGLSVILAQFHVSSACLGMAGTLVLICDFFMTSARIIILQMELVHEADHWNMLDFNKLRS